MRSSGFGIRIERSKHSCILLTLQRQKRGIGTREEEEEKKYEKDVEEEG